MFECEENDLVDVESRPWHLYRCSRLVVTALCQGVLLPPGPRSILLCLPIWVSWAVVESLYCRSSAFMTGGEGYAKRYISQGTYGHADNPRFKGRANRRKYTNENHHELIPEETKERVKEREYLEKTASYISIARIHKNPQRMEEALDSVPMTQLRTGTIEFNRFQNGRWVPSVDISKMWFP